MGEKDNRRQTVLITLSDGSVHGFTGPAFSEKGDKRQITRIEFTEPANLPDGCFWETIPKV